MAPRKPKGGVAWETPPQPDKNKPDWSQTAKELRAHPGEWMKVFEHGRYSWAVAVQTGHVKAILPSDGFRFTTTDNKRLEGQQRTCTLYARYAPDEEN